MRKLLGRTRARVLEAIAERPGCTTTELAAAARIAVASASEHTAVLRQAGLVRTVRHRNTALHTSAPLGLALLNGRSHRN
ncbi:helix-turn-helix domain-containing protein [Streptomyces sp. NPDC093675]|uniref:helix-turn-helix domain-containing protein n=1 Tax=Streptomyces sp. NPDC093675 TaxID=3366049 RepID=UPI00380EC8AC